MRLTDHFSSLCDCFAIAPVLGFLLMTSCISQEDQGAVSDASGSETDQNSGTPDDLGPSARPAAPSGNSLANPNNPSRLEITCDNSATCCPEGFTPVVGTAAADIIQSADAGKCYVGLAGADEITDDSQFGWTTILAGAGDDAIITSYGRSIVDLGEGQDWLWARGPVVARGGPGVDSLGGSNGDDGIEGGADFDTIYGMGGDDILVGGAGGDWISAGAGNDTVVVNNLCELEATDTMYGGDGSDTLILPVPLADVLALGVTVAEFEKVIVLDMALDCGQSCDCPPIPLPEITDFCSYAGLPMTGDEWPLAGMCMTTLSAYNQLGPSLPFSLPPAPQMSDFEDQALQIVNAHPEIQAGFDDLSFVVTQEPPAPTPAVLPDTWGTLPADIDTTETPCDLPSEPIDVGIAVDFALDNNCTAAEQETITEDLRLAKFYTWRALQAVQAVDDESDPVLAAALWNQGQDELALSWWFGPYNVTNVQHVRARYEEVWNALHGDHGNGAKTNIQCWKPLSAKNAIGYLLTPFVGKWRLAVKYASNPCWHSHKGWTNTSAHTMFVPQPTLAALVNYPENSIEICPSRYFEEEGDPFAPEWAWDHWSRLRENRARLLIHEFLHWRLTAKGWMSDNNMSHFEAKVACNSEPCYGPVFAHNLVGQGFTDAALLNNDNYALYARWIGMAYTGPVLPGQQVMDATYGASLCDVGPVGAAHNALCFPTNCCGNGVVDLDEGEVCDGTNFGGDESGAGMETCWTQAQTNSGELLCVDNCTSIDTSRCLATCGDGSIEGGEACDPPDFGGEACSTYGFESGHLGCDNCLNITTGGCSGGVTNSPPASYQQDCFITCENPEECYSEMGAGLCVGGPCVRTSTSLQDYVAGQMDPTSNYHPKGDFKDSLGFLYRCEEIDFTETTCVDEVGWGVCKKCGDGPGETMLGCSCGSDEQCGAPDLLCWGHNFPNGGFCWPPEGPPGFQCKQGGCGHGIRNGQGGEDASYCEHYAGPASCQPERCDAIQADECSLVDKVCGPTQGQNDCINECAQTSDCQLSGWPAGWMCDGQHCI